MPEKYKHLLTGGPRWVEMDGVEAAKLGREIMRKEKEGTLGYKVHNVKTFSKDDSKDDDQKNHDTVDRKERKSDDKWWTKGWAEKNTDNPFHEYG